jgi:TonB family protein
LIVLCRDERLETRIGGLPASAGDIRRLQINVPGSDLRDSTWIVGADQTTALSVAPDIYARRLRDGGKLIVRVPKEGDNRAVRYELLLPEAHESLDTVLTACGAPLERAEDADFEPEAPMITWASLPTPQYPTQASSLAARVKLGCEVDPGGELSDCRILEESPRMQGFGRAAVQAARRARVARVDDQEVTESRSITFNISFRIVP